MRPFEQVIDREAGVLEHSDKAGEHRLHRQEIDGVWYVVRIAWCQDKAGKWHHGIWGPKMKLETVRQLLKR